MAGTSGRESRTSIKREYLSLLTAPLEPNGGAGSGPLQRVSNIRAPPLLPPQALASLQGALPPKPPAAVSYFNIPPPTILTRGTLQAQQAAQAGAPAPGATTTFGGYGGVDGATTTSGGGAQWAELVPMQLHEQLLQQQHAHHQSVLAALQGDPAVWAARQRLLDSAEVLSSIRGLEGGVSQRPPVVYNGDARDSLDRLHHDVSSHYRALCGSFQLPLRHDLLDSGAYKYHRQMMLESLSPDVDSALARLRYPYNHAQSQSPHLLPAPLPAVTFLPALPLGGKAPPAAAVAHAAMQRHRAVSVASSAALWLPPPVPDGYSEHQMHPAAIKARLAAYSTAQPATSAHGAQTAVPRAAALNVPVSAAAAAAALGASPQRQQLLRQEPPSSQQEPRRPRAGVRGAHAAAATMILEQPDSYLTYCKPPARGPDDALDAFLADFYAPS